MKKLMFMVISGVIFVHQASGMVKRQEHEDVDSDSIMIQISNHSEYPVLAFLMRDEPRTLLEARKEERPEPNFDPVLGKAFFGPERYERMFFTAKTDSHPFLLNKKQSLYIASARGLYEIVLSLEITDDLYAPDRTHTSLMTYDALHYPTFVTMLKDSRNVLVLINPDGGVQLLEQPR